MERFYQYLVFTIIILVISGGITTINAQDIITTVDGEEKKVIVDDIGDNKITYYKYESTDEKVYEIDRSKVYRITFESGQEVEFGNQLSESGSKKVDKESFIKTRKRIVGIAPFSLIVGRVNVYYEHGFENSNNTIYVQGVIGDAYNTDLAVNSGYGLGVGYKIYTSDNQKSILRGFYVLPEIMVGHIDGVAEKASSPGEISSGKEYDINSMYFAAIAKLGYQVQLGGSVAISAEIYGGYNSLFNSHESDVKKELQVDILESFNGSILNGAQLNLAIGF